MSKRQEKKLRQKQNEKIEKVAQRFKLALFIVLLAVVFYPPYVKGLFFEAQQLPAMILVFITFAAFWVYKLFRKDKRFLETPLDYASFGFVIVYFLSVFAAVALRMAILEWLKYCMYFAVFFMLSELADSLKSRVTVLWVITASAVGVSILGIDAAAGGHIASVLKPILTGIGAPKDMFIDLYKNGRIFSTLQYPNTLAAYLMAVYFIAIGLAALAQKLRTKIIAGAASFVLLITFIFTLSRGAYLIVPFAAALYIVLLPEGSRIRGAAYAFPSLIASAIVAAAAGGYISNSAGNELKVWIWTLLGAVISVVITIAMNYALKWFEKVNWKIYAGIIAVFVVIAVSAGIYALNAAVPLELSHSGQETDSVKTVTRNISLKTGKEYRLVFDVSASMQEDKPYAYSVNVYNLNESNVLFGGSKAAASLSEKGTNGAQRKEISFTVPGDAMVTRLQLTNRYQGTGAVFDNAVIIDADTGKVVKNIKLKYKYLPENIASRLQEVFTSKSTLVRSIFYKDGLKMVASRWFLGGGGGAWQFLYFSYQSYLYWSTQAHNYPLQLAVETGILGVAVFLLLLFSLALLLVRSIFRKAEGISAEGRILQGVLMTSATALISHSFIDFDFSLSAVFLLLWTLTGLLNSIEKQLLKNNTMDSGLGLIIRKILKIKKEPIQIHPAIGIIIGIALLILPVLFLMGKSYAGIASKAYNEKKPDIALKYFKKAVSADVFAPEYKIDYANLLIRQEKVAQPDINEAMEQIRKAEGLCGYNVTLLPKIGLFYYSIREYDRGLSCIDRSIELRPFRPEEWQQKIDYFYNLAMAFFMEKNNETALQYVDKALDTINQAREVNKRNMNPFIFNKHTSQMLERLKYVKDMSSSRGRIEIDKVVFYNMPEMDVNLDGAPDQWTVNNVDEVNISGSADRMVLENLNTKKWNYIQSRELTLKNNKTYTIEVEFENAPKAGAILYNLRGVSTKNDELKPGENAAVYVAEITVPDGIKLERNTLRILTKDRFEIKRISILEK